MTRVKMAQQIQFYLCEQCASVHIGLFRHGKLFAEAIPSDAESMLKDFQRTVTESLQRQAAGGSKH